MIRPELAEKMRRWREALAGLGVLALGLWMALTGWGLVAWLGVALALGGVALALAGWQRGRFRAERGGPGVVSVDEGRLTYFGPLTGGSVAVRELTFVALDPGGRPAHWVLESPEESVYVPVTAEGADALFDVFARLPGLDMAAVLAAVQSPPATRTVLWRGVAAPGTSRLGRTGSARPRRPGPH